VWLLLVVLRMLLLLATAVGESLAGHQLVLWLQWQRCVLLQLALETGAGSSR
jgi:hypothetical protein